MMWIRLGVLCSITRLGCFQTVLCDLGWLIMHKLMWYLSTHPSEPLVFQKSLKHEERKIRAHWSANPYEEFTFKNTLESFQDSGGSSDKLIRASSRINIQLFYGTTWSWKIYRFLPINYTDSEIRLIFKAVVRVSQSRFLVTSLGFLPTNPTKVYKDNVVVVKSITANKITPKI